MKSPQPDLKKSQAPAFFSPDVAAARRFYLNLNPNRDQKLAVVCGGFEHCTPNYAIHRTTFPYYSIEYVARGSGELKVKGQTYPLQTGRVLSYGPGVAYDMISDPEDALVKYFVDFAGRRAPALLRFCKLAPGSITQLFPANVLTPLFDQLIESGLSVRRGNQALCAKLLECVVLKILGSNAPLEEEGTLAFSTYLRCRQYIEKHYLHLQALEQIADECHVNKAYLCRLFRRYDHQSPYQFLLRLKMNHAAERLKQTNFLVKQAAEEIGFADPFHFSRLFRAILGISPSAFRNFAFTGRMENGRAIAKDR